MKVLLIHPEIRTMEPAQHPPYGLLQLAAIVDELGFKVHILDNNAYRYPIDAVRQGMKEEGSQDIVGITGLTTQFKYIQNLVKVAREEFPAALIVAGGGFLSAQPFDMMRWLPELDVGAIGEAYNTWREILDCYAHENKDNWDKVKGLVYREGKKVKLSAMRPLIEEYYYCENHKSKKLIFEEASKNKFQCKQCDEMLVNNFDEQIPYPAYEFSPVEVYLQNSPIPYSVESSGLVPLNVREQLRRLDVLSSLGCPWRCYFCFHLGSTPHCQSKIYGRKVEGKPFRQHSPQYVVNLIGNLRKDYCINFVSFIDENFTVNRRWFDGFLDKFEEAGLATKIHWGIVAHSSTVDTAMLTRAHDVGLSYISYGGESGSPRILKEMGKGQTPAQMVGAVEATQAAQVNPIMSFILGFPGETIDDVMATCQFFIDQQVHCIPFLLQPYPGSELYEKYKDKIIDQYLTVEEKEFLEKPDLSTYAKLVSADSWLSAKHADEASPALPSKSTLQRELPIMREKIKDTALRRWVLALDDATKMSCNLTDFTDVELAGLQYLIAAWDIERLKKFKKILEDRKKNE